MTTMTIYTQNGSTLVRFLRSNGLGKLRKLNNKQADRLSDRINKLMKVGKIEVYESVIHAHGLVTIRYQINPNYDYVPVARLHKNDLTDRGWDTSTLTRDQLESIAEDMGESYVSYGGYWDSLDDLASDMGLSRSVNWRDSEWGDPEIDDIDFETGNF